MESIESIAKTLHEAGVIQCECPTCNERRLDIAKKVYDAHVRLLEHTVVTLDESAAQNQDYIAAVSGILFAISSGDMPFDSSLGHLLSVTRSIPQRNCTQTVMFVLSYIREVGEKIAAQESALAKAEADNAVFVEALEKLAGLFSGPGTRDENVIARVALVRVRKGEDRATASAKE